MAGVSVKMGVTGVAEFKRSMNESKESVKTLTAALKLNEAALKADGDQERYMSSQASLLKHQLEAQKSVVESATKALDSMRANGVDPNSKAFQQMQREVYTATEKMLNIQSELENVQKGSKDAEGGVSGMNEELKNVGKGVSWDNVTKGLDSLIHKLESGARAAVNLGKKIYSSVKESTGWADDLITLSNQTGIDTTTLQQMQKVADIVDTDVEAIINAKKRMARAATTDNGVESIEEVLGISLNGQNADDLFWEIGDALVNMGESFDKEAAAQKVFGRSWAELLPLFKTGREAYEQMLGEQTTLTEEQVQSLGKADDTIKQLEQEITQLKNAFWAENADKITGLFQWLIDNKDAVVAALTAIAGGFGLLKLGSFALNLAKTVSGFKELGLLKGAKDAASAAAKTAGTGATTASGSGIGATGALGLGGLALIAQGFGWAADRRNNHRELVRGTEENLTANTGGVSDLLVNYLRAEQAANAIEENFSATAEEFEAVYANVEKTHKALVEAAGGQEALNAYSDWRQENSYGSDYWEIPESLAAMTATAEETNEALSGVTQSSTDMASAAKNMMNLPALIANAVSAAVSVAMGNIQIQITRNAVDTINRHGNRELYNQIVSDGIYGP